MGDGIFGPMFDTLDEAEQMHEDWVGDRAAREEARADGVRDVVGITERVEARRQERSRRRRRVRDGLLIERVFDEWEDTKAFLKARLNPFHREPDPLEPVEVDPAYIGRKPTLRERLTRAIAVVESRVLDGVADRIADRVAGRGPDSGSVSPREFDETFPGVFDGVYRPRRPVEGPGEADGAREVPSGKPPISYSY